MRRVLTWTAALCWGLLWALGVCVGLVSPSEAAIGLPPSSGLSSP